MNHWAAPLIGIAGIALVSACPSIPPYSPPTIPNADDVRIYGELVESGCLAQDDAGALTLDQAHARTDQPPWMACMYREAGTVTSCGVPCD